MKKWKYMCDVTLLNGRIVGRIMQNVQFFAAGDVAKVEIFHEPVGCSTRGSIRKTLFCIYIINTFCICTGLLV